MFLSCNKFQINWTSKSAFLFYLSIAITFSSNAQIFEETFNEAAGSTSGADDVGGVSWSTSCPTCIPVDMSGSDYVKIVSGRLEARDTNGEGVFETGNIDISSASYLVIEAEVSESGTMEACGSGCVSTDWVSLTYTLDGGATQAPSNAFDCSGACGTTNAIFADDIAGGSSSYSSNCIPTGGASNLVIRMAFSCWAGSEYWRVDNIKVTGYTDIACSSVLPVVLYDYSAKKQDDNVLLSWTSTSEFNTDYYTIERSFNGESFELMNTVAAEGYSSEKVQYDLIDFDARNSGDYYYRLTSYDFDNTSYNHGVRVVSIDRDYSIWFNQSSNLISAKGESGLLIYSLDGKIIADVSDQTYKLNKNGIFIAVNKESGEVLKICKQ